MDRVEIRFHITGHESYSYGVALGHIEAYHLGFDVKNGGQKGNSSGGDRKAIEEAAGQICKGVNGLVSIGGQHAPVRRNGNQTAVIHIMATIFTTARLWVSDADLGAADLKTGRLPKESVKLKQVPWVYLQYPVSPALKHELPHHNPGNSLSEILDPLYMRTIAVINSEGIEKFFREFDPFD